MAGHEANGSRPHVTAIPFPGDHGGRLVRWLKRPRAIVEAGSVLAYCVVSRPPPRAPAPAPVRSDEATANGTAALADTNGVNGGGLGVGEGGAAHTLVAAGGSPPSATGTANSTAAPLGAAPPGAAVTAPAPAPRAPTSSGGKRVPLRAPVAGRLIELCVKNNATITAGSPEARALCTIQPCEHEEVFGDLCAFCGSRVTRHEAAGAALSARGDGFADAPPGSANAPHAQHHGVEREKVYAAKGFALNITKSRARAMKNETAERVRSQRRLQLVLDLDHTLLHATHELVGMMHMNRPDVHCFELQESLGKRKYYIKERPGLRTFLSEAAKICELSVNTKGTRAYAMAVTKVLDPDGSLFGSRIASRDDTTENEKHFSWTYLEPGMTIVVDDNREVWGSSPNVIHIYAYKFWKHAQEVNNAAGAQDVVFDDDDEAKAPSSSSGSASAAGGAGNGSGGGAGAGGGMDAPQVPDESMPHLEFVLDIVQRTHATYFASPEGADTRDIMREMRRKVLAGTWLILSGVFPTTVDFRATGLYQSCLSAGAMFAKSVRDATHVIANRGRTGKVSEAIAAGVPVVGLRWLTESLARWKRLDERSRPMKGFEKYAIPPPPRLLKRKRDFEPLSGPGGYARPRLSHGRGVVVASRPSDDAKAQPMGGLSDDAVLARAAAAEAANSWAASGYGSTSKGGGDSADDSDGSLFGDSDSEHGKGAGMDVDDAASDGSGASAFARSLEAAFE